MERNNPDRILDTKLRCTFVPPQTKSGDVTDRVNQLSGVQQLETEVSQLRQELTKSKEENARLSQTNADLQVQLTKGSEQLQKVKDAGQKATGGSGMLLTIILVLIALFLGAVSGILLSPKMKSGDAEL